MILLITIFAAVTLSGAIAAMMLRTLVHCALALTVAFAGLAMLYLSLDAEFAGLAQLLIYVGAIAILIVFVILLTSGTPKAESNSGPRVSFSGLVGTALGLGVFSVLGWAITHSTLSRPFADRAPQQPTVQQIGATLMQSYSLPLEVLGLMLTAAMIGAVILAMKENQAPR